MGRVEVHLPILRIHPTQSRAFTEHQFCEPGLEEAPGAAVFLLAATDAEPAARVWEQQFRIEGLGLSV